MNKSIEESLILLAIYDRWGQKTVDYCRSIDAHYNVLKGIYRNGY